MRPALALFLLVAACATPPRVDPATLGAIPPEERFTLRAHDRTVEVDHLRIDGDSVRGRLVTSKDTAGRAEIAMARDTSLVLRRAYHGTPDVEFLFLPPVLLLAVLGVFLAAMGGGG